MNRLDLGCGFESRLGWLHLDKLDYGHNVVADILEGLPLPGAYFDIAVMNHVLQMFSYEEHPQVLGELRRVLKPGGVVRVLVPDLSSAVRAFSSSDRDYFPISRELEPTLAGAFARYLFWHGDTRSAFNLASLIDLFTRNGFRLIGKCWYSQTYSGHHEIVELDSRPDESLIVEFHT